VVKKRAGHSPPQIEPATWEWWECQLHGALSPEAAGMSGHQGTRIQSGILPHTAAPRPPPGRTLPAPVPLPQHVVDALAGHIRSVQLQPQSLQQPAPVGAHHPAALAAAAAPARFLLLHGDGGDDGGVHVHGHGHGGDGGGGGGRDDHGDLLGDLPPQVELTPAPAPAPAPVQSESALPRWTFLLRFGFCC